MHLSGDQLGEIDQAAWVLQLSEDAPTDEIERWMWCASQYVSWLRPSVMYRGGTTRTSSPFDTV